MKNCIPTYTELKTCANCQHVISDSEVENEGPEPYHDDDYYCARGATFNFDDLVPYWSEADEETQEKTEEKWKEWKKNHRVLLNGVCDHWEEEEE